MVRLHKFEDEPASAQLLLRGDDMRSELLRSLLIALLLPMSVRPADAEPSTPQQEEIWALRIDLPTLAYVVHPVGKGSFPTSASLHQFAVEIRGPSQNHRRWPDDEQ